MKILITGAGGFIGQFLARELLNDASHQLVLTDVIECAVPPGSKHAGNATTVAHVDLGAAERRSAVITADLDAIYLFHGIMSAGSEADFDLGLRVNVDVTRAVLADIRRICRPDIRVIFSSSLAVYGRPFPAGGGALTEDAFPTPEGSYGAQKLMCECLINDMTRKGFINGLSLRFPTVSVRPGRPTAAASSFISGLVREPLAGKECVLPVADRTFASWVCSPKTLIWNLVHALSLPGDALPRHKRSINAPGHRVTIQDMLDALAKVGGRQALQYVREEYDEGLAKILYTWAVNFDNTLAYSLGFKADTSFEQAVRDYVAFIEDQAKISGA